MELYFLRHGKAVEASSENPDDFQRELTDKGIEEMETVADALSRLGVRPDCVLTSPLLRAKQTAEIVARRLGRKKELIETDVLAPGCTLDELKKLLDSYAGSGAVMVVGHEPDFSTMIGALVGRQTAAVELKKGALAVVEVDRAMGRGAGVLRWLVPPKVLIRCCRTGAGDDD